MNKLHLNSEVSELTEVCAKLFGGKHMERKNLFFLGEVEAGKASPICHNAEEFVSWFHNDNSRWKLAFGSKCWWSVLGVATAIAQIFSASN